MSLRKYACLCLVCLAGYQQAWGVTAAQDLKLTFTDSAQGNFSLPYNLYLPAGYDPNGPALPVILYLHGAGERGTDNNAQVNTSIQPMITATQGATGNQRAIIIAPQCPPNMVWNSINNNDNWTPGGTHISSYSETPDQQAARAISKPLQAAMDLLSYVQSTEKVNNNKLYITGVSMGAFGTWDAITRFPGKFAAAMPLSGGGNVLAASTLVKEPIWAWHGVSDTIVDPSGSSDVIDAIRHAGGTKSIYTLQGGAGHGPTWDLFYTPYSATPPGGYANYAWYVGGQNTTGGTPTYSGDTVYQWLFSQANVPEPASLTLLAIGSMVLLGQRRKNS